MYILMIDPSFINFLYVIVQIYIFQWLCLTELYIYIMFHSVVAILGEHGMQILHYSKKAGLW